jgi:adenosine deaminase
MTPPSILLCSLGTSWAVVPEVYSVLAPEVLDLYVHHGDREAIVRIRQQCHVAPPGQVWVVTTAGEKGKQSLQALARWWNLMRRPMELRGFVAVNSVELDHADECRAMAELIHRLCCHASARVGPENVVVSLAGGRKTMSADFQRAAAIFGVAGLLHIVDYQHPLLRDPLPESFTRPFPELDPENRVQQVGGLVTPLFLGRNPPSELVTLAPETDLPPIVPDRFPIAGPKDPVEGVPVCRVQELEPRLLEALEQREQQGTRLLANYLHGLQRDHQEMFPSLYRLPLRLVEQLRNTPIGPSDRDWLQALPKAELHCHLGGCLDLSAQQEVGQVVWESLSRAEQDSAREAVAPLLQSSRWEHDWPLLLKPDDRTGPDWARLRSARAAAILVTLPLETLHARLYGPTEPRFDLRRSSPIGFKAYELPGELTGSAILGVPEAVEVYAEKAYQRLRRDGVRYCELRGSPGKYLAGEGFSFLARFRQGLQQAARRDPGCEVRFIVVADRRGSRPDIERVVALARQAMQAWDDLVVGLDLAGDESSPDTDSLPPLFEPAFEACIPLTIHAGEGEPAESIWHASYRLHADRVGHGLTLIDRPELMRRFCDRGICIELNPTSNQEVVGFRDPDREETLEYPPYPLSTMMKAGLAITICTDNPGISQTHLAQEYLLAARMARGLTKWQVLGLLRNGFAHAFLPAQKRRDLLLEVDRELFHRLQD